MGNLQKEDIASPTPVAVLIGKTTCQTHKILILPADLPEK